MRINIASRLDQAMRRERERRTKRERQKREPREHMVKMAGLYRNETLGEGKLQKFRVRGGTRRTEKKHRH